MKEFSVEELARHNGEDASLPLLLSVRGMVFDVSPGRAFYGPGGPYEVFAGKECARALALMSTKAEDATGDVVGLAPEKMQILRDWEAKFQGKYRVVGVLVGSGIDLSQYAAEPPAATAKHLEPTGNRTPLLMSLAGVAAAAAALAASVLLAKWA